MKQRSVRCVENIAAAEDSVLEGPNMSLTRRSQALGISVTSLWRRLQNQIDARTEAAWPPEASYVLELGWATTWKWLGFLSKHHLQRWGSFWLNGFVNKQNMLYWSDSNPHVLHESSLHPDKITVWCSLWAGGVIAPYFFRDDQNRYVTMNGNSYRSMITEYFWPQLDAMYLEDMRFQQDGATGHTANITINLLETKLHKYRPIYAWKSSKIEFSVWNSERVHSFIMASNVLLQE